MRFKLTLPFFLLILCYPFVIQGVFTEIIPVYSYGWLDQYSMDTRHNFVGDEACVPTSSTNALTYFQNAVPFVFGNTLSGSTYQSWENTDHYLIGVMGTTAVNGTSYDRFVYALHDYITQTKGYSEVQFSGIFPHDTWTHTYPKPNYIVSGFPTVSSLSNAIAAGSAVLMSIEYSGGGGHEILINGLTWDPTTQKGTVYFVDPLDPSQNYSPEVPLGPVKQTEGTLEVSHEGRLILRYRQYNGRLPYNGLYEHVEASFVGILSVGAAQYVPFSELLKSGNTRSIALGFDNIDPTTSEMFPVMAVLNTSMDLEEAFYQLDPSIYDSLLYTSQTVAERIRMAVTDHWAFYHTSCGSFEQIGSLRLWGAPFGIHLHQKGFSDHDGFKSTLNGIVTGIDYKIYDNLFAGVGFSYVKSDVKWDHTAAKGDLQNYGGIVYGLWERFPYWVEASFSYSYDHIKAQRSLYFISSVPFVAPINATLKHKENIKLYLGHLGTNYDIYHESYNNFNIAFWPYLNVDYVYAIQSSFRERGDVIFAQTISEKKGSVLFAELGLGGSLCQELLYNYRSFLQITLSYVREAHLEGKHTHAYFNDLPETAFTVSGLNPQNNLCRSTVILGITSPNDVFRFHIAYQGDFGSQFTANEISAEISVGF